MRTPLKILLMSALFSSCCSYDDKDFEFTSSELSHFGPYQIGDTIYFESDKNDVDTIMIIGFDTEINRNCGGLMAKPPINGKWIRIRHLPIDKWHGTTLSGNTETINYQELFWISKDPLAKEINYATSFKDFHSSFDTIIGKFHTDTLTLNDIIITNYYLIDHDYPERITKPENIKTIIWTDKYGLTAYENNDKELWTIKLNSDP